ncbi:DUF72 domain-containing protein [Fulvivirgaceae bacterium PWU4]|uniref:DUF72 domain-containing protein n=1 Tax=Chryseosolibacter histidini TaxID=2782349 RepID=A0AAP2GR29_9BACT|nr:DUF72 domain-containing protein [Chryseosolibacter histidini]MBT1700748.1 DUF72 domain-containing protein [Chryseosolibacter histidini]
MAAIVMVQWRIGCSGYHYAEWKGQFYPQDLAKSKWFDFYGQHFNTVELNMTFYRFPRVEFLKNWYNRSPEHFRFSVKAPRVITHFKRMREAQRYLLDFYEVVRQGLHDKLGPILFQFPASFKFDDDNLDRIVKLLDPAFNNVVEFRDVSWWQQKVYDALSSHGITFAAMSHPTLSDGVVKTTDTVYYRFHGVPHLYTSRYELQKLEQVAQEVQQMEGVTQAYIYFNNTAEGAAIVNAREFQEISELVH